MILPVCRQNVSLSAKPTRNFGWPDFRISAALAAGLVLVALPVKAQDATLSAYHERNFILAANAKCSLFSDPVERALGAAALQTRGVLLRSGHDVSEVGSIASRAAGMARNTACSDATLVETSQRIVHAFARWERAARLEFPSKNLTWRVDRFAGSETGWRMVQDTQVGTAGVRFGLAGQTPEETAPTAVVSFKGRSRPYAARLVMRDTRLLPRPHAVSDGEAQMPPLSSRQMIFAARQSAAPKTLLSQGTRQGEAWVFPQEAMDQVAQLDPREPFWIEFLFRDDSVAQVRFEAGDAAAARSFLSLGAV